MPHRFYRVVEDTSHPTAWWLGEVRQGSDRIDCRTFTRGQHLATPGPLIVTLKRRGEPQNLSFTLLNAPVASSRVAALLDKMAPQSVERFPVRVDGCPGDYELLNVVRVIDAVDLQRSEYSLWKPEDGRPDLVGTFRQVLPLVIKSEIRQDAAIFRPKGWEVALIVSARLKLELEKIGGLGVRFRPLEGGFSAN